MADRGADTFVTTAPVAADGPEFGVDETIESPALWDPTTLRALAQTYEAAMFDNGVNQAIGVGLSKFPIDQQVVGFSDLPPSTIYSLDVGGGNAGCRLGVAGFYLMVGNLMTFSIGSTHKFEPRIYVDGNRRSRGRVVGNGTTTGMHRQAAYMEELPANSLVEMFVNASQGFTTSATSDRNALWIFRLGGPAV